MVLAVVTFFSAPLEAHADPQITPLHTQAPWYFLWLQGLLKLGDKSLMGVVVPTVIFSLLFAVPWIDRNPYRLASRRKVAIAVGIVTCLSVLFLTYMGTPTYGIETPPAQDILSHLTPATHPGPVRELPWDQLEAAPDGGKKTYFVSYPAAWEADPEYADPERYDFLPPTDAAMADADAFHELLMHFKAEVENEPRLIAPIDNQAALATLTVELIQPKLKWLTFTITWDELVEDEETGESVLKRELKDVPAPDVQRSVLAIHKDANY